MMEANLWRGLCVIMGGESERIQPIERMKCDAELYAAAMGGGPEAFAPIVERYQDAVFGIALARLGNFHDAEDVAQGVFVKAFERLGDLKSPARLGAWLRTMTIHDCINKQRRRRELSDVEHCERQESKVAGPQAELERGELREQVLAAIRKLSKTQRETTTLFYINGYSVAAVASIQEVPVGTVKRRLHEARKRLKEEMMGMVEDVLKAEAPKEDFGERVFDLLCRYRRPELVWPWEEIREELRRIGVDGVDGFVKAMQSPHSGTRRFAAANLGFVHTVAGPSAKDAREMLVQLLKEALGDRDKKVRKCAAAAILGLDVDEERRIKEFVPLLLPLLTDRSWGVRRRAAYELSSRCAESVPLETAAHALAVERRPRVRRMMERLVLSIIEAREKARAAKE